ncbi:hypothetical protein ABMA70_07690 [Halobacteriovorax sp. XZX-3]|uniref:hypothetical protein n=1 Tax=unclassified Halobacteriovorax TaxID=2639665 RepID=UPI003712479A
MGKFLKFVGIVSLIMFTLVTVGLVYLFSTGSGLDDSSQKYADSIIENNVKGWKAPIPYDQLSLEFKESMSEEDLKKFWTRLSTLGDATSITEGIGEAKVNYIFDKGKSVTASYKYVADYETCKANIYVNLKQESEIWKVYGFKFMSVNNLDCF